MNKRLVGFSGHEVTTDEQFMDYIVDNTGSEWDSGNKISELADLFLSNQTIIEKIEKELQKRIDEEEKHISHPKQIYRTVQHNCEYNLTVCKNLKEILHTTVSNKGDVQK